MERIAKDGKRNVTRLKQLHEVPEPAVQDGVAPGNVKVRQPVGLLAHVEAIFEYMFHFTPGHLLQLKMVVFRKNIAMLAALVTAVCYVPLKGEIFHGDFFNKQNRSPPDE